MITDIIRVLFGFVLDKLREEHVVRMWLFVGSAIIGIVATTFYFVGFPTGFNDLLEISMSLSGIVFFFALLSFTPLKITADTIELELNDIKQEREQIKKRISTGKKEDIFDTIQLSLNQLNEYYTINKSQARNSFRFSVFAVVVGLATIVGGIWIFLLSDNPNIQMATITGISGALIEAIGALYFHLYKKSLDQLNLFYERLTSTQDTMLAIRLLDKLENPQEREEMQKIIIKTLITKDHSTFSRNALPGLASPNK